MSNNQPSHTGGVKTVDTATWARAFVAIVIDDTQKDIASQITGGSRSSSITLEDNARKLEAQLQSIMQERLDQQHNELTDNERKVWLTTEQLEKRLQDYANRVIGEDQEEDYFVPGGRDENTDWRVVERNKLRAEQRTTNQTLKGNSI